LTAAYLGLYWAVEPRLGPALGLVGGAPVLMLAWFYGARAGAAAGVLIALFNGILPLLAQDPRLPPLAVAVSAVFTGVTGALVGQLREQAHALQQGEAELERRVREQTAALTAAVEALRAGKERFRALIENASDLIVVFSPEGRLKYASPSTWRMLGGSPESTAAWTPADTLHPDDIAQFHAHLRAVTERPRDDPRPVVYRLRDRNEAWRTVEATAVNLLANPAVNGLVFTARDITDRTQTEENLRQRDSILEAVAFAAEQFLRAADWRANITAVLARFGQKTRSSHVYVFENHLSAEGVPVTSMRYEWTAPGIEADIHDPLFQNVRIHDDDFGRWDEAMLKGEPFHANLQTLTPSEARYLIPRGIKSLLDVPIYIGERWWGVIGFDDIRQERAWSSAELEALKAAATILSAAIQRQGADAALRESERLYRGAIEAADAVPYYQVYSTDSSQRPYAFMGEGVQRLTGYTAQEMTPEFWRSIVQEAIMLGEGAGLTEVEATARSRRGQMKVWQCDYRIRTRAGEMRWISDRAVEVLAAQGGSQGSIGILQDITDRKQVEATLAQQADEIAMLYRASARLAEAANDPRRTAQLIVESVVNDFGLVACGLWLINEAGTHLHRWARVGRRSEFEGHDIVLDSPGLVTAAFRTGEVIYAPDVSLDPRYLAGDPHTRSEYAVPLRTRQRVMGVLNIESPELDAISERERRVLAAFAEQASLALENARLVGSLAQAIQEVQRLNAELEGRVAQRTEQLEAANRELEAFSYSVSHDLRAPLRAIDGFTRIVLEDYAAPLDEAGRRYLHKVRDGVQHMSRLIEDLLAFSRLGRQALKRRRLSPEDLAAMVNSALETLRLAEPQRRVEVELGALPACLADHGLLAQVFANLLANAFKFTRERAAARIELGAQATPAGLAYFVRDNGVGFDMRYADRLFGVFQRLHSAEQFEGAGVGLAIVQRVISRHGGRVWAEAELEKGAAFYFTLGSQEVEA
jgi:PAS domain S-box-containing protein